jgi:hypothetical protein
MLLEDISVLGYGVPSIFVLTPESTSSFEVLFIIPARDASRSVDGWRKRIGYSIPDGPAC